MALNFSSKSLAGIAMMLVGSAAFVPGLLPGSGQMSTVALLPAALLLTLGTYLVGVDGARGRPV